MIVCYVFFCKEEVQTWNNSQERLIERRLMICKIMKMDLQLYNKFVSLLIVISKIRIVKTSLQMKSNLKK